MILVLGICTVHTRFLRLHRWQSIHEQRAINHSERNYIALYEDFFPPDFIHIHTHIHNYIF